MKSVKGGGWVIERGGHKVVSRLRSQPKAKIKLNATKTFNLLSRIALHLGRLLPCVQERGTMGQLVGEKQARKPANFGGAGLWKGWFETK
jgi:hypothetical protein